MKLIAKVQIVYGAGETDVAAPGEEFEIADKHAESLLDSGAAEKVVAAEKAKTNKKADAKADAESDL
jgi:hypothetical protein